MKLISILPAVVAVCTLSAPLATHARDKDKKDDRPGMIIRNDRSPSPSRSDNRGRNDNRGRSDNRDRNRNDHDRHDDHRRGPHVSIRPSYGYGYGYGSGYGYGYGSSYYGRSPYYYSRPGIGFSYYSRPSTVYRGQAVYGSYSDSLAVDVQRELRRRGYYRGSIDGDIGPGSRAAIRAYQYDRGLSASGRIDSSLLRSLGIG